MTNRERFLRFMAGEDVDRPLYWFGGPRPSTFAAWMKQGLSEEQRDGWREWVGEERGIGIGKVDVYPLPRFEVRVLAWQGNKKIWIDEMGVKRCDHIDPATPGFVTRSYLEFPVKNRDDFLEMKKRYNPADPMRYLPADAEAPSADPATWKYDPENAGIYLNRVDLCDRSDETVGFVALGPYWTIRDWVGFENLSMMFYDQPALVHEMMDFWTEFLIRVYDPVLSRLKADYVIISEDMAYKTQAMISPPMMREFMVPRYRRMIDFFHEKGVDFVVMDSDGHNSQILQEFVPAGLQGIQPIEIAAGNDPAVYLEQYPGICMWGGIDKRELRFDRARARAEVRKRFEAQRRYRRYLPCNDHGVPPDIPLRNFLYVIELIKGFSNGEDLDSWEPPGELEKELGPIEEMFDPLKAVPHEDDEYDCGGSL